MGRKPIISLVRSGGQTGTDRAALLAARKLKYPIAGWCPKGGWAEDMTQSPGLRKYFPEMVETPSAQIAQRTEWNVRDSHATIVIGDPEKSFGTSVTADLANAYERPYLIVGTDDTPADVLQWLGEVVGRGLTVNFAGPRESEAPGTQEHAIKFIYALLKANIVDYKSGKDTDKADKGAFVKAYTEAKSGNAKSRADYARKEDKDPFADLVLNRTYLDAEPEPQVDAARQEAITAALFGTSPQTSSVEPEPVSAFEPIAEPVSEVSASKPEPKPARPKPEPAAEPQPATEAAAPKPTRSTPKAAEQPSTESEAPKPATETPTPASAERSARPPRPGAQSRTAEDPKPPAEEPAEPASDEYEVSTPVVDDDYVDPFAEFL